MQLIGFRVRNYRSIVDSQEIRIEPLQGLVGENNAGKSNLLYALQAFLTPGTGGVQERDLFDPNNPIVIAATFGKLTPSERTKLRIYLLGERLVLEKHIWLEDDPTSARPRPHAEYHGYVAKPKDWWLSTDGVLEHEGSSRPDWHRVAEEHGILDYVINDSGKVNKTSYEAGLRRLLVEREDIEFEEPQLGETQALGLQPALLKWLPNLHFLPAITDYADEIDRRSTSTSFRRLMGDLSDRILRFDPRFGEVELSLRSLGALLNAPLEGEDGEDRQERLATLGDVEEKLQDIIAKLMPSVRGISIRVDIDSTQEIFSRGVSISVDDGRLTDVLVKGHGLQRCVVFGLLQALIMNQRGQLIPTPSIEDSDGEPEGRAIILAIEEPELYIHPQMQRLVYGVLKDFSATDQVIYSTHSPAFVDVAAYEGIGLVRKDSVESGTYVRQCEPGILAADTERKTFQFLSSFSLESNQVFFAKKVILVEGDQDVIAVMATGRELDLFDEFPEERGYTVVHTDNKSEMPKYMKLLNAFAIPYAVLHELDNTPTSKANEDIRDTLAGNKAVTLPGRLEDALHHDGHFNKTYDAKKFFENPDNITEELKKAVKELFS